MHSLRSSTWLTSRGASRESKMHEFLGRGATRLGASGAYDVFVTASDDIAGLRRLRKSPNGSRY